MIILISAKLDVNDLIRLQRREHDVDQPENTEEYESSPSAAWRSTKLTSDFESSDNESYEAYC